MFALRQKLTAWVTLTLTWRDTPTRARLGGGLCPSSFLPFLIPREICLMGVF
jgi:hypothetical protein